MRQQAARCHRHGGAGAAAAAVAAATMPLLVVETAPEALAAAGSRRAAFFSCWLTLTLAIVGSSVLPAPVAFAQIGSASVGVAVLVLAAVCNVYTSLQLLDAAYATGLDSYEALSHWVGGKWLRRFTQAVLIALLWVPQAGALMLLGDAARALTARLAGAAVGGGGGGGGDGGLSAAAGSTAGSTAASAAAAAAAGTPLARSVAAWLAADGANGGTTLTVLACVLVVYPLSVPRRMRSLGAAAVAGMAILLGLMALLLWEGASTGFPGVASGDFALGWRLTPQSERRLPEAFSLLGFCFYAQPLALPLLRELPEGKAGRQAITGAVVASLLGSSFLVYGGIGLAGAALFGAATKGDVLLNDLLGPDAGAAAALLLYLPMLLYLAAGAAASQYPLRASLDLLLVGGSRRAPMTRARSAAINALTLGSSLLAALAAPGGAERVYAAVGATGVCVVCYVLPVMYHVKLLALRDDDGGGTTFAGDGSRRSRRSSRGGGGSDEEAPLLVTQSGGVVDDDEAAAAAAPPRLVRHSSASSLEMLLAAEAAAAAAAAAAATAAAAAAAGEGGGGDDGGGDTAVIVAAPAVVKKAPLLLRLRPMGADSAACRGSPCAARRAWAALMARRPRALVWACRLVVPLAVAAVGTAFSVAALYVALVSP